MQSEIDSNHSNYKKTTLAILRLKTLLIVTALVGALSGLCTAYIALSSPEGWWDPISAGITEDGLRAFWHNHEKDALTVIDLPSGKKTLKLNIDAIRVSWSRCGKFLIFIIRDINENRLRFAWMNADTGTLKEGPFATYAVEAPKVPEMLLIGEGDYLRNKAAFWARRYKLGARAPENPVLIFGKTAKHGKLTSAEVSHDGRMLGASRWRYGKPSEFGVWSLPGYHQIVTYPDEASYFFFDPKGLNLYTIRSFAAIVQLHKFDLTTRQKTGSSESMAGSCLAAKISKDLSEITLARSYGPGANHLEVYSTQTLTQVDSEVFPNERFIVSLQVLPGGTTAHAIGRSGVLWKWDRRTDVSNPIARIGPELVDYRWRYAIAGWILYGLLWISSVLLWQRTDQAEAHTSKSFHMIWLLAVVICEAVKWYYNISDPSFLIIETNLYLVGIHLVAALTLVGYLFSLLILKMPLRIGVAVITAIILSVGAGLDYLFFWAAVASV